MRRPKSALAAALGLATALTTSLVTVPTNAAPPELDLTLDPIGTHRTGIFDDSAAEIVAHDPGSQRLFVVNFSEQLIDVIDVSDPANPTPVSTINDLGGSPNSVDVHDGLVAVALEAPIKNENGEVAFYDVDGNELNRVPAGALPDMLTFTPDGKKVVVANEGEPLAGLEGDGDPYTSVKDPAGSVSVIDLSSGVSRATVQAATFEAFNSRRASLVAAGVRINPAVATVAQDLEPEYVTVAGNSRTAWVSLQENNAIAEVNLTSGQVTTVTALGRKDHSEDGNGLDPSDRDPEGAPVWEIRNYDNLYGIHMPDAIANVSVAGRTYLLTANEGDAREYTGLTDVSRVKDLRDVVLAREGVRPTRAGALCETEFTTMIDGIAVDQRPDLIQDDELGRLNVSTNDGYDEDRGCFFELHALGARSFSIFTTAGDLVYDSGEDFERIAEARFPDFVNSNHTENSKETRSDDKGPEPEAITTMKLKGRQYALVGLERMGGILVYDVTDPRAPRFVDYANNRDFTVDPEEDLDGAGDLGAEGVMVIDQGDSPNGETLVAVANEVSGTTTLFELGVGARSPVPGPPFSNG